MSQQAIDQAEKALSAAYKRVVDRHSVAGALDLARAVQAVGVAYLEDGQLNKGYGIMNDAASYYLEAKDIESSAQCLDQVAEACEGPETAQQPKAFGKWQHADVASGATPKGRNAASAVSLGSLGGFSDSGPLAQR